MTRSLARRSLQVGAGIAIPSSATAATSGAQPVNATAIMMFLVFVALTLSITYWAARRTKTASDFYAAGGNITGLQNGLAIAGDFMSAASFLGISGLIFGSGFDGLIYAIGGVAGWPIILFLLAERLRNLGRYTFADAVSFRLQRVPIRCLAASGALVTVLLYLVAQMVGAGKLIEVLFGVPYTVAVLGVGGLMVIYVSFGGMIATTWVQIIKAVLLLTGASLLALLVLQKAGFSIDRLFRHAIAAHDHGIAIMAPGGLVADPISAISLGIALIFGTAGLPHILMRFFTVPNAREARRSVFIAGSLIGYFYILTFIIGFGAVWLVTQDPAFRDIETGELVGGNNMASIHLAAALGGDFFLGFISAVTFATILAVVSGLTLSGASSIAHDLYANVWRDGDGCESDTIRVSRIAASALGVIAMSLSLVFEEQNVAYMVVLAFAVGASVNFPLLLLALYWRRLTTTGAVAGGALGLLTAIGCMVLGPTIWVEVLGNESPIFPYKYPALFAMTATFAGIISVSLLDHSQRAQREIAAFDDQFVRSQTGIGAAAASRH